MPFGLVDAHATCQRLVDNRFIRGAEDRATGYVDDIAVQSNLRKSDRFGPGKVV